MVREILPEESLSIYINLQSIYLKNKLSIPMTSSKNCCWMNVYIVCMRDRGEREEIERGEKEISERGRKSRESEKRGPHIKCIPLGWIRFKE